MPRNVRESVSSASRTCGTVQKDRLLEKSCIRAEPGGNAGDEPIDDTHRCPKELPGRDLNPDYLIQSQAFGKRKGVNPYGMRFVETSSDSTSDSTDPETAADARLTAIALAWPLLTESTRQMVSSIVSANMPRGTSGRWQPKPLPTPHAPDEPGDDY